MEKLKKRWGISSNWQILLIILVFGITGSSSVYIGKPILEYIGMSRENFGPYFIWGGLLYYALRLVLIFPLYQMLLVLFGFLFGQFKFFWTFEKNMLMRMGFARIFR